ncbi:SCO1 protein [Meredithblackwellia eburnea MCA 4105]
MEVPRLLLRSSRPLANFSRTITRPQATSTLARRTLATEPSRSTASLNKNAIGPFTLRAGALFGITGVALYFYFQAEKQKVAERKAADTAALKVGKPKIGGPFVLTKHDGTTFSDQDLLGKWSMVYFGFTNCPDICPEELDKVTEIVKSISASKKVDILPIFITCDPARDNVDAIKAYVKDFHPSLIGLTGSYEDIKATCKAYRVYFSTPPNALPTDDYLVDHSIFFYLMDPNGKFVDAFGRSMGPVEVTGKVQTYIDQWEAAGGKPGWSDLQ